MIEKRFSELRQTGERRIEGVVIPTAKSRIFHFGKEKFVAGAFGDVASLDVILKFGQHQSGTSPAWLRTGGGGADSHRLHQWRSRLSLSFLRPRPGMIP